MSLQAGVLAFNQGLQPQSCNQSLKVRIEVSKLGFERLGQKLCFGARGGGGIEKVEKEEKISICESVGHLPLLGCWQKTSFPLTGSQ